MSTVTEVSQQHTKLNLYEGMFLLDSANFAGDPDGLTRQVLDILERSGGEIVSHRPWQDGKLAYEIAGHRKGLHYLVYFRMPGGGLRDVARACKLNEAILRQMVIAQPQVLFDAMIAALEGHDGSGVAEQEPSSRESPSRGRGRVESDDDEDEDE